MSAVVTPRVLATGTTRDCSPRSPTSDTGAANVSDRRAAARPAPKNIGCESTGCGVGIDALASPIGAHAIAPPFRTSRRRIAKYAGIPQHQVGELADLHRADLGVDPVRDHRADRVLGDVPAQPQVSAPRRAAIACAVCHVRTIVSPTRPIACESDPIIEIAPMSCNTSSAAIVVPRMRLSANARSSGMRGLRWWQTISMSARRSRSPTVGPYSAPYFARSITAAAPGPAAGRRAPPTRPRDRRPARSAPTSPRGCRAGSRERRRDRTTARR